MTAKLPLTSARQRLKNAANGVQQALSDLCLIFDKELRQLAGDQGDQFVDLDFIQAHCPDLKDLSMAQLRRAIKYDAKHWLELHPELDQVRRLQSFQESEAVDRMLYVDEIEVEDDWDESAKMSYFEQLLWPFPTALPASSVNAISNSEGLQHEHFHVGANDVRECTAESDSNDSGDDDKDVYHDRDSYDQRQSELGSANDSDLNSNSSSSKSHLDQMQLNLQTVIRPFAYRANRFFLGFCFVEYPSESMASEMLDRVVARNRNLRVMPMKQWRKLESQYLGLQKNQAF